MSNQDTTDRPPVDLPDPTGQQRRFLFLDDDVEVLDPAGPDDVWVLEGHPAAAAAVTPGWALVAAAADAPTGAMIALVPADQGDPRRPLALDPDIPGAEAADDLHLTLAYLGEAADWTPTQRAALLDRLGLFSGAPTVDGHIFGAAHWNTDGPEPSWVLNVGGDTLEVVHGIVWDTLRTAETEVVVPELPDQHAPWVPHICLAYTPDPGLSAVCSERVGEVSFDRLRVAFGDQVTDIGLQAATPPIAAAAGWEVLAAPNQPRDARGRWTHSGWVGGRWGMGDMEPDQHWVDGFKGGSAEPFLVHHPDGTVSFTPERQAVHDKIIEDLLANKSPPKSGRPTYHVLGGGPASGKTSLLDSPAGAAMRDKDTVRIGLDDIRAELPGYKAKLRANPGVSAGYHQEAAWVTSRATLAAQQHGLNMTLDTTGDSGTSALLGRIEQAKTAGYRVEGHYVTVPLDTAIQRAQARGQATGRFVPTAGLTALHANVSRTLPVVMPQFDTLDVFDNRGPTGSRPKRIMHWDGETQKVEQPRMWQEFLDKANAEPGVMPVPEGA